jgi:hypothetical protein
MVCSVIHTLSVPIKRKHLTIPTVHIKPYRRTCGDSKTLTLEPLENHPAGHQHYFMTKQLLSPFLASNL